MATSRTLRVVTAATFLPAFPLCLAHGIVSGSPVPAAGLVPLAFSAGVGIFLLSRRAKEQQEQRSGNVEHGEQQQPDQSPSDESQKPSRPVLVFLVDVILATAILVVLVFTWIRTSRRSDEAMLAAYATMPLLINFCTHLYLAVRELSRGLALPGLIQWLAWKLVPPDCPDCHCRLRPESAPSMPWFESLPKMNVKMNMPAMPKMKAPEWKTPAWLRRQFSEYDEVPTEEEAAEQGQYTDEPEEAEASSHVEEPVAVDIVGKKRKNSRRLGSPAEV
ncbi:hypothetical protein F5Y15DRAFT_305773 [Xylariaceae sp. FL0016]|nr:hypothetical protein F5Y15DRAFT_305773 [Xylariaceae sp. FL0016]